MNEEDKRRSDSKALQQAALFPQYDRHKPLFQKVERQIMTLEGLMKDALPDDKAYYQQAIDSKRSLLEELQNILLIKRASAFSDMLFDRNDTDAIRDLMRGAVKEADVFSPAEDTPTFTADNLWGITEFNNITKQIDEMIMPKMEDGDTKIVQMSFIGQMGTGKTSTQKAITYRIKKRYETPQNLERYNGHVVDIVRSNNLDYVLARIRLSKAPVVVVQLDDALSSLNARMFMQNAYSVGKFFDARHEGETEEEGGITTTPHRVIIFMIGYQKINALDKNIRDGDIWFLKTVSMDDMAIAKEFLPDHYVKKLSDNWVKMKIEGDQEVKGQSIVKIRTYNDKSKGVGIYLNEYIKHFDGYPRMVRITGETKAEKQEQIDRALLPYMDATRDGHYIVSREKQKITQSEIAKELGISQSEVSKRKKEFELYCTQHGIKVE